MRSFVLLSLVAIATAIPFAQKHYYGNPYLGCEKGEANVSVTGVPGLACMPKCNTVPGYIAPPKTHRIGILSNTYYIFATDLMTMI